MCCRVKGGLDNAMGGLLKREKDRPSLSRGYLLTNPVNGNTGTGALTLTDSTASL